MYIANYFMPMATSIRVDRTI